MKRVGGFTQLAFAAFWLVRGAFNLHGQARSPLSVAFVVVTLIVLGYGIRVTAVQPDCLEASDVLGPVLGPYVTSSRTRPPSLIIRVFVSGIRKGSAHDAKRSREELEWG